MNFKRTLTSMAALSMLAMLLSAPAAAQLGSNLPPPGAYQPIPNYSGVDAGLQFRTAINNRFSGVQPISPSIVNLSFANLPSEQDGQLIYCNDCQRTAPCSAGGSGAWAFGEEGQWRCDESGGGIAGIFDVKDFGAVCSSTTATATAIAGTAAVSVNAIGDFAVGEHVKLDHAGAASALATPSITSVTSDTYNGNSIGASMVPVPVFQNNGSIGANDCHTDSVAAAPGHTTSCTTDYCYRITAVAQNGSWSAPSATVCSGAIGPNALSAVQSEDVNWSSDPNAAGYLIYRCSGAGPCTPGNGSLIAVIPNLPAGQTAAQATNYFDEGNPAFGADEDFGTTPPAASEPADLLTTITAINGTTVTLAAAPAQSGTFTMRHDDAPAIQAAINAACPSSDYNACGTIYFPRCSDYYHLAQAVSTYGQLGPKIVGANDTGQGSWGTALEWDGATGGVMWNLNKSAFGHLEGLAVPGISGNTPGIVYDLDNYAGAGAGTSSGQAAGLAPTSWRFYHLECGEAGICFELGGAQNNDRNLFRDISIDAPNGPGGWIGYDDRNSQSYDEVIQQGMIANRDVGVNFTAVGSFSVRDIDYEHNIVDNSIGQINAGSGDFDGGLSEGAQYFLFNFNPNNNYPVSIRGMRLGDSPAPPGWVIVSSGPLVMVADNLGDAPAHAANIAVGGMLASIGNVYQDVLVQPLTTSPYGAAFPATPGGFPVTSLNGAAMPTYTSLADTVNVAGFGATALPFTMAQSGTATPLITQSPNVYLVNSSLVSSADSSPNNAPPTVASCGSSPAGAVHSGATNNAFSIAIGGGTVTSCAVTFGASMPFANAPVCTAQDVTKGVALTQTSASAGGMTLGAPSGVTSIGGDTINVACIGK
jgi:hypothetical protein